MNLKTREEIVQEFASIINRYSIENDSNTPDFILAEYLADCLDVWAWATKKRESWYRPQK